MQEGIDNDDGSCYYKSHDNFLVCVHVVWGARLTCGAGLRHKRWPKLRARTALLLLQGMKNDFGGHSNYHFNNLYAYVGEGLNVCTQLQGFSVRPRHVRGSAHRHAGLLLQQQRRHVPGRGVLSAIGAIVADIVQEYGAINCAPPGRDPAMGVLLTGCRHDGDLQQHCFLADRSNHRVRFARPHHRRIALCLRPCRRDVGTVAGAGQRSRYHGESAAAR